MRILIRMMALCAITLTPALRAQAPRGETPAPQQPAIQQPPPPQPPAPSAGSATPHTPAEAMEASLARQRAAIVKQTGAAAKQSAASTTTDSFFVLPPPARLGATVPAPAPSADCDPLPQSDVDALIRNSAKSHDVDEDLLRSVMQQESAFRPCAVSPKGALGLMQLMPATATQFGATDPFDPARNVDAGAAFLKQLLERYGGNLNLALGAYNAGPAKVDGAADVPAIPETKDFIQRVLSAMPPKK
jgi:soluble lytic murein transglycosylase-like protein